MDKVLMVTDSKPNLDDIVKEYGNLVSVICSRMVRDPQVARDAAQEVWVNILTGYSSFRGESSLSTWIYTITRRVAMHYARHERTYSLRFLSDYFRTNELEIPDQHGDQRKRWVKEQCDHCLTGMLHCLSNEIRLAFIFRDIAELSYAEIAEIFDQPETAMRQKISRARRKLRNFMHEECYLYNPDGKCNCRLKGLIKKVDLDTEYKNIGNSMRQIHLFRQAHMTLPDKNFWLTQTELSQFS